MCGIVYAKDFRGLDVVQRVMQKYQNQRLRGTRGFGFYIPESNQLYHNPEERPTLNRLRRTEATEMLFHHRFPTSTANMRTGCHPYSTRKNRKLFKHEYILVHNGVLNNHHQLKGDHEALGIKYVSAYSPDNTAWTKFNDSEALLYDAALYLDGQQEGMKARGSIAFVVIEKNSKGRPIKLHWARNSGNPLKINHHQGKSLTIASEGGGDDVPTETLFTLDYKTGVLSSKPLTLTTVYAYTAPAAGRQVGFQTPRPSVDNPLAALPANSTANRSSTYMEQEDDEQYWLDGGYYDAAGNWHQVSPPESDPESDPQSQEAVFSAANGDPSEDALEYLDALTAEFPKDTLAKQLRRTQRALERAQRALALLEDVESEEETVVNKWMDDYEATEQTINTLEAAIEILYDEIGNAVRLEAQKGATR